MQNSRKRLTGESQAPGHFGDGDVQGRDYIFKQDFTWVSRVAGLIHVTVRGEVYEYRSYPLAGLGAVTIDMKL